MDSQDIVRLGIYRFSKLAATGIKLKHTLNIRPCKFLAINCRGMRTEKVSKT
jgi:predicted nucleic-acid-binding Zn-ribbon protein